jgi:hypothetical protein
MCRKKPFVGGMCSSSSVSISMCAASCSNLAGRVARYVEYWRGSGSSCLQPQTSRHTRQGGGA